MYGQEVRWIGGRVENWSNIEANRIWDVAIMAVTWSVCLIGWLAVAYSGALVTDNRPRRNLQKFDIDSQL